MRLCSATSAIEIPGRMPELTTSALNSALRQRRRNIWTSTCSSMVYTCPLKFEVDAIAAAYVMSVQDRCSGVYEKTTKVAE